MKQMISKRMTVSMRAAMMLAVVMMAMFVMPQGTQAQTKYKIETDGNCEVYYYDNFERIVVTEAEAGKKLSIWLKEDANPSSGKYFTGEYTLNGSTLGKAQWGGYNDEFTMPAKAVKIVALQDNRKSVTLDLTTTTRQEIPAGAALQFNSDNRVTPDYENGSYDMDNSGVTDLIYFDEGGEHAYVQRLEGADASGTITLTYSGPTDSYGSISFVFPMKERIQLQSGWITLSHSSYEYDGTAKKPTVTVNDGAGDITTYFDITYNNNTNAGNAAQVTVTAMSSQTIYKGSISKTFTITPKAVTISGVKAKDKVYNGTTAAEVDAGSATIEGKVGSDEVTVNVQSATATFADANAGEGKNVTFSGFALAGTQAGNYVLSAQPASVKATITPKPVTISVQINKVYDGTTTAKIDAGSVTIEGKVEGDNLTVDAQSVTVTFADAEAGKNKPVTLSGKFSLAGEQAGNYTLSAQPAIDKGTISPKPVTVKSGLSASKVTVNGVTGYSVDATNVIIDGAVNNEDLSIIGVSATLQNGSTEVCDLDYTTATIVIGVEKANNYIVAKQGNQATAPITAIAETVENADGSTTETSTATVNNPDGSTTETTQKKETKADGCTTETTQEKVTHANGSTTETTKEKVTDAEGKTTGTKETTKEAVKNANGSTTEKTTEIESKTDIKTDADGTVTNEIVAKEETKETKNDASGTVTETTEIKSESTTVTETKTDGSTSEKATGSTTETKTDASGKTTTTTTAKESTTKKDASGQLVSLSQKETVTNPDNSQKISEKKTLDVKGINVNLDNKGNVIGDVTGATSSSGTVSSGNEANVTDAKTYTGVSDADNKIVGGVINNSANASVGASDQVLFETGGVSNVLLASQTVIDANKNVKASTASLTVMQNAAASVSTDGETSKKSESTTIAINTGANTHADAKNHADDKDKVDDKDKTDGKDNAGTGDKTDGTVNGVVKNDDTVNGGGKSNANAHAGSRNAKSTVTVNHANEAGNNVSGGKSQVEAGKNKVTFAGGTVNKIVGGGSRAASAEEQENDEIEIVSGREYELLHDGYIVLNFYTPDAAITVNSIIFRRPGDANGDDYVDAADLVEMINAKNGKASERFNLTNADIDRDGEITQADIDAVVEMIMDKTTD